MLYLHESLSRIRYIRPKQSRRVESLTCQPWAPARSHHSISLYFCQASCCLDYESKVSTNRKHYGMSYPSWGICQMAAMEEMWKSEKKEGGGNSVTLIVSITDKLNSHLKICFRVTNMMNITVSLSSKAQNPWWPPILAKKIDHNTKSTNVPFLIVL